MGATFSDPLVGGKKKRVGAVLRPSCDNQEGREGRKGKGRKEGELDVPAKLRKLSWTYALVDGLTVLEVERGEDMG